VRVIVDTHAFVWMSNDAPSLSARARSVVTDASNELVFGIGSAWEMAIKHALGKLELRHSYREFIDRAIHRGPITLLPITLDHLARVGTLPHHHRDPFDRLLVAQSMVEGLPIVSADAALDVYGIQRIW
jgi:PIN domain nuclease of toxin-antitoxin system